MPDIVRVARSRARVKIASVVQPRLDRSYSEAKKQIESCIRRAKKAGEPVTRREMIYGVTTGFGTLKDNLLTGMAEARKLQENLIISHCTGVGNPFPAEVVRAVMLIRANTLAAGRSGVRYELLERLVALLNADILPVVQEQGSVGASGDLAPMAHLALGLLGKGPVDYRGARFDTLAALANRHPRALPGNFPALFPLAPKEGLALLNGTSVMAAVSALAYHDAARLCDWADAAGAAALESVHGSTRAFDEIVFQIYQHEGARVSAANVRAMTAGSALVNRAAQVHDPYSVRCIPQVHGAARDALKYVGETLRLHLASVTDDPVFFTPDEIAASPPQDGWLERLHFEEGHFHGEPLAIAMDVLAIAVSELASISERRIQMLLDPAHSRGLPPCLVGNAKGINSGYLLAQYTAAALASENKVLAHPASVDSIPTSANAEDHVSMGLTAARKARQVVENVKIVLAIELLCATEALSFRMGKKPTKSAPGKGTARLYALVRGGERAIPLLKGKDTIMKPLIDAAAELISTADPLLASDPLSGEVH